jgi:hypothetical protein
MFTLGLVYNHSRELKLTNSFTLDGENRYACCLSFHGLPFLHLVHEDNLSSRSRDRAMNEKEVLIRLNLNNSEVQGRHPIISVTSGHTFAFKNLPRIRTVSNSPTMPKIFMGAMAFGKSGHPMSFHDPGESSPFCPPYNIHQVSRAKNLLDRNFASNLVGFNVVRPKLSKNGKRALPGLLAVPKDRPGNTMGFLGPEP